MKPVIKRIGCIRKKHIRLLFELKKKKSSSVHFQKLW